MGHVIAADFLEGARPTRVTPFTAVVDGNTLVFKPTGAFARELADGDDEVIWDVNEHDDESFVRNAVRSPFVASVVQQLSSVQ